MTSIAIIGAGISGLGCAYLLHRDFEITMFESSSWAGGHSNTIEVRKGRRSIPVDTGFMVFNRVNYPQLSRLFDQLGVATKETSMSFGVQHCPSGIEYCGSSLDTLFAQRRNLLRPRFWRLLGEIRRFNRDALQTLREGSCGDESIGDYLAQRGYDDDLGRLYLMPMAAAIWSSDHAKIADFPAASLLRFFENHGLLGGLDGHHQWRTIDGGAATYVRRMTAGFRDRIRVGLSVLRVERRSGEVVVHLSDGTTASFDRVVLACHSDQALALLREPSSIEEQLLGAIPYQKNVATLHTDPAPMPKARRAWASWNYRIEERGGIESASTIYWMNRLQGIGGDENYFVSVNDPGIVDRARVIDRFIYHHPVFDREAVAARRELPALNRSSPGQRVFFCGAYFGNGFHEDGFRSAIEVSRVIASDAVWEGAA